MLVCMILPKDPLKCSLLFTFHCSDWVSSNILSSRSHTCSSVSPQFSSLQSLSHVWLFATLWTVARQASLSITNSGAYSDLCPSCRWCHLTISFSCPLLLLCSVFPSIKVFSSVSVCIRWPKYWSFSSSISPSNVYSGLISFGMDWLDLPAVQRTLKSLLQNHHSKASILWCSAFFIVQLSHPYMTIGKTIVLTRWTFVSRTNSGLSSS